MPVYLVTVVIAGKTDDRRPTEKQTTLLTDAPNEHTAKANVLAEWEKFQRSLFGNRYFGIDIIAVESQLQTPGRYLWADEYFDLLN